MACGMLLGGHGRLGPLRQLIIIIISIKVGQVLVRVVLLDALNNNPIHITYIIISLLFLLTGENVIVLV